MQLAAHEDSCALFAPMQDSMARSPPGLGMPQVLELIETAEPVAPEGAWGLQGFERFYLSFD